MTATSRRGSRQMRHCSSSATLPQMVQNRTLSLTSVRADTRRRTSTGSAARRWKAIRCALLGPTPGSRPSSSMRSWTAPSYMRSEARQAQAAEITETAGDRAHLLLGQVGCCPRRVAHSSDDEVLQRLDVVRVDGLGVDRHGGELATAGHRRPHQAAAGASLDLNGGELLLRSHQLLLHLLRLLHELLHVRLRWHAATLRAGRTQTASISPITCAPRSRCNSDTASASVVSSSRASSRSRSTTSVATAVGATSAGGGGAGSSSSAGGPAAGGGGPAGEPVVVFTIRSMPATSRMAS